MANHLALELDRRGLAEMSCIAGVGGDVPALLHTARSGRPIVVLDGCPLRCARSCLARHGLQPDIHHTLSDYGVKKRQHQDFELNEARAILARLEAALGGGPGSDRTRGDRPSELPAEHEGQAG